jgi:hypothetical protein
VATFLTTPKMSPALAARIEASVRGRRGRPAALAPRLVSIARLGVVAFIVLVVVMLMRLQKQDRDALEGARASLLDAVRAESSQLAGGDQELLVRVEASLVRAAGAYEGDRIDDALRAPGALAAALARPMVYVRAPLRELVSASRIAEAASVSSKDPLVTCLLDPPASRAEKALLSKVRATHARTAAAEEKTANVHRLHDAEVGLPFLLPRWSDAVRAAKEPADIGRLRRDLERAPLVEAKRAAHASALLYVMDEPGDGTGPTELDGERAHFVRIGLVDLASSNVVLRLRKRVDPAWISQSARSEYASGLDGCLAALDVRDSVIAPAAR